MSKVKKLIAGSVVAIGAFGAAFPAITGVMLENSINERLEEVAEKYSFSVSSVEMARGFDATTVDIVFEGSGLKKIARESLIVTGVIKHSTIFNLPEIYTSDLDFTYSSVHHGVKIDLPGTIRGALNWDGSALADFSTDAFELPVDSAARATLLQAPVAGKLVVDVSQGVVLDTEQLRWNISGQTQPVINATLDNVQVRVSPNAEHWAVSVPALSMTLKAPGYQQRLSIEDIAINGEEKVENNLLNTRVDFSAGQFSIPALANIKADKVIEGFSSSSSVENLSLEAITELISLIRAAELPDNTEATDSAAKKFMMELSKTNPRFALEDFTLKTSHGDISLSSEVAGTDRSRQLLKQLTESDGLSVEVMGKRSTEFLMALNSSLKVSLSDELLDWSCKRIGEQVVRERGGKAAEGKMIGSMCSSMAKSGEFLSMSCMTMQNTKKQAQCIDTMNQVKNSWVESNTLEVALKDGQLLLNNVVLDMPLTI